MPQLTPDNVPETNTEITPEVRETPINIPPTRPRKVYGGMWGKPEIAVVAAASLFLLAATLMYFFFVIPSNRELSSNKSEADRLEAELISARTKYGEITDSETQVAKLATSVSDFETRFLPAATNGRTALYQRMNGLIRAFGLTNTSGPDYSPLEPIGVGANQQSEEDKGRDKFRSLYPGTYVTTTVEGSYQNLRRFLREVETGQEFIVISAVELAPSDTETKKRADTSRPAQPAVNQPNVFGPGLSGQQFEQSQPTAKRAKGKMHGEVVALRVELVAYFRRPNFVPVAEAPVSQ